MTTNAAHRVQRALSLLVQRPRGLPRFMELAISFLGVLAFSFAAFAGTREFSVKVCYVTSTTAYIDVGTDQGVQVKDRVEIVSSGAEPVLLEVTAVSSRRASCVRVDPSKVIQLGDKGLVFASGKAKPLDKISENFDAIAKTAEKRTLSPESRLRSWGLRGRIGARYIGQHTHSSTGSTLSQPGLDVRADGQRIAQSDFGAKVDVRALRSTVSPSEGESTSENRTRVMRLSTDWTPHQGPWNAVLGRQLHASVSSIGIFDGLTLQRVSSRWTVGALAGTQPELGTLQYSTDTQQAGAFVEWRSTPGAPRRWSLACGTLTSQQEGEIARDFAALQMFYGSPRWTLTGLQEVDLNRGWRREEEGSPLSITSSLGTARMQITERVSCNAGFDNRRNVRIDRDTITPETDFDDRYRQGIWGGTDYRFSASARVGVSVRNHSGGSGGSARSATLSTYLSHSVWRELSFNARATRLTGDVEDGWLYSVGGGFRPVGRIRVDLAGGLRETNSHVAFVPDGQLSWASVDLECPLSNPLYLLLSAEQGWDDLDDPLQIYASAVYRF